MPQATVKLNLVENLRVTGDDPQAIRKKVAELVSTGEPKLKDIEKATSFGKSTISQALSGKYQADDASILDAIARFYRYWVARHTIVRTKTVEEIGAVIELTWKRKEIGMVVGRFGRGKSEAALLYVAQHPDYARFIELSGASSPMELLNKIAEALDIKDQINGPAANRLAAIIRHLQRNPMLLIVDEADELKPKSLKLLRDIHGDNQERCAIILIASDRLLRLLQNDDLGYLRSRIPIKRRIGDIDIDEAKQIADRFPHDLDRAEIKQAWDWSVKHDGIRSFVNLLKRAYDIMQMKDLGEIDSDCLKEAYSWLID